MSNVIIYEKILTNVTINGAESNKPSKRSKKPPCPGIVLPESLMAMLLLKRDSTKSPNVPATTISAPIQYQAHSSNERKYIPRKKATMAAKKAPPTAPSHDFFGRNTFKKLSFSEISTRKIGPYVCCPQ